MKSSSDIKGRGHKSFKQEKLDLEWSNNVKIVKKCRANNNEKFTTLLRPKLNVSLVKI